MSIEKAYLGDGSGAYKTGAFVELRAGFHTATAGNTAGQWIRRFLILRGHARAGTQVVSAIDRNPGFDRFQIFEQNTAVDRQVTHDWKLGKWFQLDGLFQFIHEC